VPASSLTAAFASSSVTTIGRSPLPPTPSGLPPALTRRPNIPGAASHNLTAGGLSSFQFDPGSSSHDDVHAIAGEVGEYIEVVVKEWEREWERLRRERESSGPSMDTSPVWAISVVNTPASVGISSPTSATLMGNMNSPPIIGQDATIYSIPSQASLSVPLSAGGNPTRLCLARCQLVLAQVVAALSMLCGVLAAMDPVSMQATQMQARTYSKPRVTHVRLAPGIDLLNIVVKDLIRCPMTCWMLCVHVLVINIDVPHVIIYVSYLTRTIPGAHLVHYPHSLVDTS